MTSSLRQFAFCLVGLALSGCGYQAIGTDDVYRDDVTSVSVTAATNATDRPEVAAALTDALVRELEQRTPYRVTNASSADTLLEVAIVNVNTGTPLRSRDTGFPQVSSLDVVAEATWTDLRDGRTLLRLSGVEGQAERFDTLGEGVPVTERSASEALAARIVDEMAARW